MSMTLSLVVKLIEDERWDNASETVRLLKYRLSSKDERAVNCERDKDSSGDFTVSMDEDGFR